MTSATASIALLFPGQASQYVGMGEELIAISPAAAEVMRLAEQITSLPLRELCARGALEDLTRTAVAQPAVVAVSIMAWEALKERLPDGFVGREIGFAAGHSVGEYAALVAAEALDAIQALELVQHRAALMAEACDQADGVMAAIMGLPAEAVRAACEQASHATRASAEVANLNAPGQVVISGDRAAVEEAGRLAREAGARRVLPINVGGPFHSRAMRPAGEAFGAYVNRADFRPARFPVVLNQTAFPTTDVDEIRRELVEQIWSPVRWVETLEAMSTRGCQRFIELGPGKVISGMAKRTVEGAQFLNVQDVASLRESLQALVGAEAAAMVPESVRQ